MSSIDRYQAAYAGLLGVLILATLPLFIVSCFVIPQRKDTARRGFIWLKIAFLCMFLSVLFLTVETILILLVAGNSMELTVQGEYNLDQIADQLSYLGSFFQQVAFIFVLFALVDVGLGILYCWNVMRGARRIVQLVTYGFGFVEVVLAIAILAKFSMYSAAFYAWLRDESNTLSQPASAALQQFRQLLTASDILMWIASLAVVAFSIYVVVLANKRAPTDHRQASILLLVASIIWAISNTWNIIGDALWLLPAHGSPEYTLVVNAIVSFWTSFVTLVLLFVIGAKKFGGLWSIPQNFPPPAQYYGHNGYGGAPMVQQPYGSQSYAPQPYGVPQVYYPPHSAQLQPGIQQPTTRHEMGQSNLGPAPTQFYTSELRGSEAANELHSQTIKPY